MGLHTSGDPAPLGGFAIIHTVLSVNSNCNCNWKKTRNLWQLNYKRNGNCNCKITVTVIETENVKELTNRKVYRAEKSWVSWLYLAYMIVRLWGFNFSWKAGKLLYKSCTSKYILRLTRKYYVQFASCRLFSISNKQLWRNRRLLFYNIVVCCECWCCLKCKTRSW